MKFDPYTMKPITIEEHKIVFATDLEPEEPLLDFDEWTATSDAEKDR